MRSTFYLVLPSPRDVSTPFLAGFFFVSKKDGSLRPCIDYSPLKDITSKNRYPFPLISSAIELLQKASVFTKLDLRNAYHLIRLREGDEWQLHLQSSRQTEHLNQEIKTCLWCLVSQNQATWSDHLNWVEYDHNTLPSAANGLSPFQCANGYQPPLFMANKKEVTVPTAYVMVRRHHRIWTNARWTLLLSSAQTSVAAGYQRQPTPLYQPGQMLWLATKNLPLQVHSRKLVPRLVGSFPISKVINPMSVCLHLPRSLRVHLTFHVSRIIPIKESTLVPGSARPPPAGFINRGPVFKIRKLPAVRNVHGSPHALSWTKL